MIFIPTANGAIDHFSQLGKYLFYVHVKFPLYSYKFTGLSYIGSSDREEKRKLNKGCPLSSFSSKSSIFCFTVAISEVVQFGKSLSSSKIADSTLPLYY